jgi:hypothetical protein
MLDEFGDVLPKDRGENNGWKFGSKTVSNTTARKKNLESGMCYEFRVRAKLVREEGGDEWTAYSNVCIVYTPIALPTKEEILERAKDARKKLDEMRQQRKAAMEANTDTQMEDDELKKARARVAQARVERKQQRENNNSRPVMKENQGSQNGGGGPNGEKAPVPSARSFREETASNMGAESQSGSYPAESVVRQSSNLHAPSNTADAELQKARARILRAKKGLSKQWKSERELHSTEFRKARENGDDCPKMSNIMKDGRFKREIPSWAEFANAPDDSSADEWGDGEGSASHWDNNEAPGIQRTSSSNVDAAPVHPVTEEKTTGASVDEGDASGAENTGRRARTHSPVEVEVWPKCYKVNTRVKSTINVHGDPRNSSAVIGILKAGLEVLVYEIICPSASETWVKVKWHKQYRQTAEDWNGLAAEYGWACASDLASKQEFLLVDEKGGNSRASKGSKNRGANAWKGPLAAARDRLRGKPKTNTSSTSGREETTPADLGSDSHSHKSGGPALPEDGGSSHKPHKKKPGRRPRPSASTETYERGDGKGPQWFEMYDQSSQSTYYIHSETEASQWDPPVWLDEVDATTGNAYYRNTVTGQTQWQCPAGFIPIVKQTGS